ncbi:glutamate receptor 2.4-like isoform X1 [Gossypium raimondii]|uniref:glutamate receptor 2.4-like isoform X1 n=1 Tax=Gossypium raimondii TaxID=29730 RepID=UPI00227B7172|nr:glutamate receptor 2.4-like isoform X1 [Gossypium raimondii]
MAATLLFSTSKPLHYYTELSIAVPVRSIPSQFLNISHDDKSHNEAQITGFWIDLFKEAIAVMPINTTYKLVPFYGSDDQLFDTSSQAIGPWLVLILVVSSTYTQSFTSTITTSSDTESSSCLDIENLKKANAIVGCDTEDSIMLPHLVEVIGFRRNNNPLVIMQRLYQLEI